MINATDDHNFDSYQSKDLNPSANEYVPMNSMTANTAGAAGISASQVITENQRKGLRDQQIFHTFEQSDFHYSAQVQQDNMGVHQVPHVLPLQGDPLLEVLKRQ